MRTTYQKAEAKYNVTTEFPSLGLHSAASTGNVGLVEYALDHGQPINSVLDGVLPLHAACAGGNVQVVKLLIDHGADVNAPRLPRRYSNDKNRDSSAPIVGTSGSTPLHFAAANGNTDAVTLLLLHGAHADRPDKYGVTPEMLAQQYGWLECATVLKNWLINKDKDLRERPNGVGVSAGSLGPSGTRDRMGSVSGDGNSPQTASTRRRLQVKHSIDNALNKFKSSTHPHPHPPSSATNIVASTPPASPTRPFEYTFYPVSPSDDPVVDTGSRRPSLPQVLHPSSIGTSRSRKTSTPTLNCSPSPRRPRSAGTGTEGQEQEPNSPPGKMGVRRLGSKYSLMNIFKKAQAGESLSTTDGQSLLNMSPPATGSIGLPASSSPSPSSVLSNTLQNLESTGSSSRQYFRFHRGSDASTRTTSQQSMPPQSIHQKNSSSATTPSQLQAVDLVRDRSEREYQRQTRDRSRSTGSGARFSTEDNINPSPSPGSSPLSRMGLLRAHGHKRDRSGSSGSLGVIPVAGYRGGAVFDDDVVVVAGDISPGDPPKSGARPSILKVHNRTSSSGHVPGTPSSGRALRFDSSSSVTREGASDDPKTVPPALRGSSSTGSLGQHRRRADLAIGGVSEPRLSEEDLTPETPVDIKDVERGKSIEPEEDEDEYGQPLERQQRHVIEPSILPRTTLLTRERGLSFASSSQSSLSPIMSNDVGESSLINSEFPFSINKPPAFSEDMEVIGPSLLRVPSGGDNRNRGDSISSTSTTDSRNHPQLSISGTTSSGSGSDTVTTPWFSSPGRERFLSVGTDSVDANHLDINTNTIESRQSKNVDENRHNVLANIDISSISSHAQAEALVHKAQQDILDMAHSNELSPTTINGRSPLSARLAAYGESLALERRLREKEEDERRALGELRSAHATQSISSDQVLFRNGATTPTNSVSRRSVIERQRSLEHRFDTPKRKSRAKDPKRPSTAEGTSPGLFEPTNRYYHSSTHNPELGTSPTSQFSIEEEKASSSDEQGQDTVRIPHIIPAALSPPSHDLSPELQTTRSRTPVPDTGEGQLSRISSLECPDTDTDLGPSLLRVSTAPHAPGRGKTATKLARMGFPPIEQTRTPSTNTKRFGFRSLVQTLKGKT
ncbi:hypothetical protein H0H81_001591 [Sphagnurus paluster]|uniref:Uncharacterized protein n=1 Tax=Sphagnurus paluster TaxID=117069 RepID=A0A9P7FYG8_9AGAR|nr:hypothetical protein H0H81_001591 [Sphagnurus paluster]